MSAKRLVEHRCRFYGVGDGAVATWPRLLAMRTVTMHAPSTATGHIEKEDTTCGNDRKEEVAPKCVGCFSLLFLSLTRCVSVGFQRGFSAIG